MDGNEYILFYSKDARIKLARIDNSFIKNQIVLERTKDDYGVEWKKVSLEFKTNKKNISVSNTNNLWINETELYQRCGSCHSLHPFNEFTPNQWPSIVKTMQNNAGFTKSEAKNVSIFLQYKSLKGN
jgi:nitrate/TMAO reductase-like tetraheme cytochrome c subunit